jgi:alpha-tubulin suppressor-like RCC1 family protein
VEIACASCVSYAVDAAGVAYAWGFGENHQLGSGSDEDLLVPTAMAGKALAGAKVKQVCVRVIV